MTPQPKSSDRRRVYVQRIIENHTPEDIYSEERQRQWMEFSQSEQQKIIESKVFVGFVKASGLPVDPFDHENEDPPRPDIRLTISGQPYYFELGEIVDRGFAWSSGDAVNKGEITGCAFAQWEPLLNVLGKKCESSYRTDGSPVDLLLHFSRQRPFENELVEKLKVYQSEIAEIVTTSNFSRVWIYSDCTPRKIHWKWDRQVR